MTDLPPFLKVPQVAEILGVNRESIYRAVSTGEMKAVRVGRSVRIPRDVVMGMLGQPAAGSGEPEANVNVVTVRLPAERMKRLRQVAKADEETPADVVRRWVLDRLDAYPMSRD